MKKAVAALALLGLLSGISVWNIRTLDALTAEMEVHIERSRICRREGDLPGAERALSQALSLWYDAERYTHVFLRHPEVNDVTDAFFDVSAALSGEDTAAAESQYDRLEAHLDSIDAMEHVTWKSVF